MKSMKRSIRRHHYARIKLKWTKITKWCFGENEECWIEEESAMLTTTHTRCSCYMCCNERKVYGPTLQEHKSLLSYKEDLLGL